MVAVLRHRAEVEERVLAAVGLPVVTVPTDVLGRDEVRALLADLVASTVARVPVPAGGDA